MSRGAWRYCLVVFVAVWAGWALLSVLAIGILPHGTPISVPGIRAAALTPGWHNLLTGGDRQDALWYLRIAAHGYHRADGSAAFFPLYPLAIRVVSFVPGVSPLGAATGIAWVSAYLALVTLYALTKLEFSEPVARRSVVIAAVFPTGFFLLSPYTEAPFLALTLAAFLAARRNRWGWAALAAALAAATRSAGVLLIPALVAEALHQRPGQRRSLLPRLGAALATLLGPAAYGGYWWVRWNDPLAPLHAQRDWQRVAADPLATLWHALQSAWRYQSYWLIDLLVVGVVIVAVVVGARRLRPAYVVYAAGSLLLPLCDPFPPRPLLSMPRFVVVVFPAVWVLAAALERRRWPSAAVVAPFAAGFALCGALFTTWQEIF